MSSQDMMRGCGETLFLTLSSNYQSGRDPGSFKWATSW